MKVLIVEDETLLAKQLKKSVEEIEPQAQIVAHTTSIQTTVSWLETNAPPDLILMDIELADGQCFEIFKLVTIKTPVIFTTAYDDYTLQAFKVNSIDYLLKPINKVELEAALHKFKEVRNVPPRDFSGDMQLLIHQLRGLSTIEYRDRFLVKQGQKMVSIDIEDVGFFSAKNTVVFLTTKEKQKFIIDFTLDEIEGFTNPRKFFRANRQFIISHDVIIAVHPWFNGKLKVDINIPLEEEIVISRDKAPLFKAWMGE